MKIAQASPQLLPGDKISMPNSGPTGTVIRWYVQRGAKGFGEPDERVCEVDVAGRGVCVFSEAFARRLDRLPS
ncbi:hypothetical protein FOZ76_14560 [Verticiella sediminum]|uniref:DUF2158 domain-containing protein n=1 Tax=Verticiella sediminum TaxID=1247510 RepID=A0A556AID9_9BURK|nr:hypothetical protein [Verticiella sediminum]TSH92639.1 hypothetical protein FOZ76_14560 [Verticiella sediminum]